MKKLLALAFILSGMLLFASCAPAAPATNDPTPEITANADDSGDVSDAEGTEGDLPEELLPGDPADYPDDRLPLLDDAQNIQFTGSKNNGKMLYTTGKSVADAVAFYESVFNGTPNYSKTDLPSSTVISSIDGSTSEIVTIEEADGSTLVSIAFTYGG